MCRNGDLSREKRGALRQKEKEKEKEKKKKTTLSLNVTRNVK